MIIEAKKHGVLCLGKLGENEVMVVKFPLDDIFLECPNASLTLLNRRPKDPDGYPVVSDHYRVLDNYLYWTVMSEDLVYDGIGETEIIAKDGTKILKDDIYLTSVDRALDKTSEAPDPWKGWTDKVGEDADRAEAAVEHYPKIVNDYWYVWDVENGQWVNTGVRAQGSGDMTVFAPDYSTLTFPILKGQHCTHGEGYYTAKQYIQNEEEWTPEHWDDTTVGGEAEGLESAINAKYTKPASGIPASDLAAGVIPDVTGKADKVSSATNGHFAGLDASGNLTDSGSKASDFLTQHQDISGKADKVTGATNGNFAGLDANGNLTDSGHKSSDYLTQHQDISGKADKVTGATNGNFAGLNASGNLVDSGKKPTDFTTAEIVSVSDNQPSDSGNKLWIKDTGGTEYSVPTYAEHQALQSALTSVTESIAPVESSATATAAHAVGELFMMGETLLVALSAIAVGDTITTTGNSPNAAVTTLSSKLIKDVQVNGSSVLNNGVANIPVGSNDTLGVLMVNTTAGLRVSTQNKLVIDCAVLNKIKAGTDAYQPIVSNHQHESTFYGLAKAAGDSTQSASSNSVGTYTEDAKSKISSMLTAPVSVSGSTPSITAKSGVRYICGECSTLSITAPASGCIDVVFESGSTATVLTVTSAKSGVTAVKWANGFDPTSLEANTVYELNILDGEYGVVGKWT